MRKLGEWLSKLRGNDFNNVHWNYLVNLENNYKYDMIDRSNVVDVVC